MKEKKKEKSESFMQINQDVEKAIKILKEGGIVIFPTDTAFGIGCRIDNEKTIQRLFEIRKRPCNQATPVLVDSLRMAEDYLLDIPKEVINQLIKPYWPGALTIVLPCKLKKVPSLVRGEGNNLGVRMPKHKTTQTLIQGIGVPILGPSANFHGDKTPYQFEDLNPELIHLVDYVIHGKCSVCQASTVIDCSVKPWRILRKGAVRIQNFNQSVILFIDSASNKEISVGVKINGKGYITKEKIGSQKAQAVLPMIEKLLKKHKLNLKDLTKIEVNTGSGSFTGLRVGIAIANALAFALKISVNEKKKKQFVEPKYE